MKKYVLEIGGPSMYIGYEIESRILFNSLEEARAKYEEVLKEHYTDEQLACDEYGDCELREVCESNCCSDSYIDCWSDDEEVLFLAIYDVEEE